MLISIASARSTGSWSQGKNQRYAYYHCPPKAHCHRPNIPRQKLDDSFLALLERLRPRPEFLALFRRIVLDVWKTRKQDFAAQRSAAEKTLLDLKRRKEQLVEAFVFQKAIDQTTYQQHLDRISEAMALAELDRNAKRKDELDIEAVLDFAERVALNAARLWLEADLPQRQRFQSLLFPEGLQVTEGGFRTPVTLVAPAGTSSNPEVPSDPTTFACLEKFLRRLDSFRRPEVAA